MKKLLVLGGKPIASVDIVNYANALGVYTIVTDNLLAKDSPAKQFANESWMISTAEVDVLADEVKKHQIDAVFTGAHEFNIARCIDLAERTGLYFYVSKQDFIKTSNKAIYKPIFKEHHVPVVQEFSFDELIATEDTSIYPVLLKPVDASGGYGIKVCHSLEEVKENYQKALSFSDEKKVIIERYIKAEEVSAFYYIENGKPYLLSLADRHKEQREDDKIALPIAYIFPSKKLKAYQEKVDLQLKNAIESMHLKDGLFFVQALTKENHFWVYDVGFRITGTQEYNLFDQIFGFNALKQMLTNALQLPYQSIKEFQVEPTLNHKYASIVTFIAKPSRIDKFVGLEKLKEIEEVIHLVKNHQEAHTIPENAKHTLNQVVLRVFLVAKSLGDLKNAIQKVNNRVDVLDENNKSIIQQKFRVDNV